MADLITDVGDELMADLLDGTATAPTLRAGWGTGAGTTAKGDTVLFTEASEARVLTTNSQPSSKQNQLIATITADGTKTITNAGVLDAASAGNLIAKSDFAGIGLALNDSIQFTFQINHA
ncbi:MAG: hypothetical protein KUG64_10190 [Cycloclasticus sp.]|nr:hypothetical protein [Cycloclasticus sp.]